MYVQRFSPGTEISFWNDVWTDLGALSDIALKPITSHLQSLRVCDVVCDGGWDLRMVKEFLPEDVKLKILSMHAGGIRSGDDTTIWKLSHNVPLKVKIFLWTLIHDRLLTNKTRVRRGLAIDALCPRCDFPLESLDHLFKDCTISMRIWSALHSPSEFPSTYTLPFNDWLLVNLKSSMKMQYEIPWCCYFAMGLWHIWKWRCSFILDQNFKFPSWPSLIIHQFTRDYFEANKVDHSKPPRRVVELCWHFSPKDWFKLNVDGSLHKNTGIICAGGVLQNDRGEWLNGFSAKLGIGQVLEAELWGLLKGMEMAWQHGCNSLEVEVDSLVAVKLVLSVIDHLHTLYSLIANCQE
ncbi:hypothetical protein ACLB2K_009136 [Fragaria x ananassa]